MRKITVSNKTVSAMALVQLIYVSSATFELSDEELDRILESSVRHNQTQDVTGMLLYSGGSFMQVLEGEETAINETYARICLDPRHHTVLLLSRDDITKREFSSWHMGFHRISPSDATEHAAYAPMFINGFNARKIGSEAGLATNLLKEFSTSASLASF